MVQRYELEEMSRNPFESYRCLEENDEGDWVKYEGYAAIENLLIAVVAAVGPSDIPDQLLDALCKAGVLE